MNWPPAYASWFAAGMLLAEWTVSPLGVGAQAGPQSLGHHRYRAGGLSDLGLTAGRSEGPGSRHTGGAVRDPHLDGGAIVAGALLAPLVLDRPDTRHPILGSRFMVTLGRWSYGLFVWHLAALVMVFPMVGRFMFNGNLIVTLVLTLVLGFAMAAVSYA